MLFRSPSHPLSQSRRHGAVILIGLLRPCSRRSDGPRGLATRSLPLEGVGELGEELLHVEETVLDRRVQTILLEDLVRIEGTVGLVTANHVQEVACKCGARCRESIGTNNNFS